jgi:hypothetical protein
MAECRSVVEVKVCLTAPLHSRSVRCDLAKFPIIYPDLRRLQSCNTSVRNDELTCRSSTQIFASTTNLQHFRNGSIQHIRSATVIDAAIGRIIPIEQPLIGSPGNMQVSGSKGTGASSR